MFVHGIRILIASWDLNRQRPDHARSVALPPEGRPLTAAASSRPAHCQPPAITDGSVRRRPDNLRSRRTQVFGREAEVCGCDLVMCPRLVTIASPAPVVSGRA
jgi:hypothetical protein